MFFIKFKGDEFNCTLQKRMFQKLKKKKLLQKLIIFVLTDDISFKVKQHP